MMGSEEGTPFYLDLDGEAIFAVLHEPPGPLRSTAVLMVPPFGWEETGSYRSRRIWATSLARDRFAVLRFDLPGTGDSAGAPESPGLVDAWLRAISSAAAALRATTGCSRVAAIGPGLGGLLACVAAAAGADLDELVLWAVPARGRAIVRELRAFAQLEGSHPAGVPPIAEGALTVNGYLMSAETAADVGALDVRARSLAGVGRALLLDRDRLPVDEALRTTLLAGGTDVTVAVGNGYGTLMAEPQLSAPPWDVISTVSTWLADGVVADGVEHPDRELRTAATFTVAGIAVRERLMTLDLPAGPAFGVLAEPEGNAASLCAVLLNAGAIRRAGPNRMWVEAARRWAARGVPTLRLDLTGIGDAGGTNRLPLPDAALYERRYGQQVVGVLDALADAGLPPRMLLAGLCSGAYWSFQVGQVDDRVAGVVMLNPMALVYDPGHATVRLGGVVSRIRKPGTLGRIVRGEVAMAVVARAIARRAVTAPLRLPARVEARRRARRTGGDQLDYELDRLRDNGAQALLVLSAEEALRDELARDGRFDRLARWPNLRLRLLDGPGATHMLQPLVLQEQAHALMDSALDALLDASCQGRAGPTDRPPGAG